MVKKRKFPSTTISKSSLALLLLMSNIEIEVILTKKFLKFKEDYHYEAEDWNIQCSQSWKQS